MQKNKWYIILLLAAVLCSCRSEIDEIQLRVERCADAPVALTSAAGFSVNGKGYVFAGRNSSEDPTNRLYEYDPSTDRWTELGATPLKARVCPRALAVDNKAYIGFGINGLYYLDSSYLADLWQWSPDNNQWKELAAYPSDRTVAPILTTDRTYIYAGMGGKQNFERWIFRYDIANDSWIQLKDGVPRMASYPPRAHNASGAWCQGHLLLGAGYTRDGSSDFWVEAEVREDSIIWHRRKALSGKRHNAVAVAHKQYIYLIGGDLYGGTLTGGMLYDDVLRYDVHEDKWTRVARLPDGERENMVAWVIGDVLYVGLGNDKRNKPCAQLYKIYL